MRNAVADDGPDNDRKDMAGVGEPAGSGEDWRVAGRVGMCDSGGWVEDVDCTQSDAG